MTKRDPSAFKLIVTIVNQGEGEEVLQVSRAAGAEGGTVLAGRGVGIHETEKILGIPIEPRKEIVLTVVPAEAVPSILAAIRRGVDLDEPGHGIGFVIDLEQVVGMPHLLDSDA